MRVLNGLRVVDVDEDDAVGGYDLSIGYERDAVLLEDINIAIDKMRTKNVARPVIEMI